MTKEAVEQLWQTYLKAYGDVSLEERKELLRQVATDDITSTNPDEEANGFEALLAHVNSFQTRLPGAYFTLNQLFFHHDQVLAEWTLFKSDGTVLRTAHTYGLLDHSARLKQLTGFF